MRQFIFLDRRPFTEPFPLRSLLYGEGVFETFRWKIAPPVFWNDHIERMKKGAEVLEIPFPEERCIREAVETSVLRSEISDAYVKICLLSYGDSVFYGNPEGSSLLVVVRAYQFSNSPLKACVSSFRRNSTSPIPRIKSLNYLENILARREARNLGFDEAIFLNEKKQVMEGSSSNIFWLERGVLFTPSLECGLLSGVTRKAIIKIAEQVGLEVREERFRLGSLLSSRLAFFTNSLTGAVPISCIDKYKLSSDLQDFNRIRNALFELLGWI